MSWPMFFYTGAIWVYYIVFRTAAAPITEGVLAETEDLVAQVLTLLTAAPVLMLVGGWVGAAVGRWRRSLMREHG